MRDSNRVNEVKRLCSQVTGEITEIRERHPDATSAELKRYYLEGDPFALRTKRVTVRKMLDIFLQEVQKGLATYDKYRVTFERFDKRFGVHYAEDIVAGDIKSFLLDLKNKEDFKPSTVRNYYKRLKSAWDWSWKKGLIHSTPFLNLKMKFQDPDPVFLDYQEYLAFKTVKLEQDYLKRTRDAWLFMAGTGLEWVDLKNLQPEDVRENGGFQTIKKSRYKTGVEYFTVLVDEAPRLWKEYQGHIPCPPNQDFNRWLKIIAEKANISKKVTTLTARHTMASLLIGGYFGARVPIEVIMRTLGHTNTKQSLRYATLTEESQLMAFVDVKR
jgi:integrase